MRVKRITIEELAEKEKRTVGGVRRMLQLVGADIHIENGKEYVYRKDWEKVTSRVKRMYHISDIDIERLGEEIKQKYNISGNVTALLKHRLSVFKKGRAGRRRK